MSPGSSGCASDGVWAWLRPMFCGEAFDAVGVVSFLAEVLAGDVPVGAFAGAGCLDVGGLLARLPAAGHDERAGDGRALRAVDVLRVAEAQAGEVVAGECSLVAGDVELDQHLPGGVDVEDFAAAAVLDAFARRARGAGRSSLPGRPGGCRSARRGPGLRYRRVRRARRGSAGRGR